MNWSADAWSAGADCVTALAAVAAGIAAWRGLQTWRRQEVWREDKELARAILRHLKSYQDLIGEVRSHCIAIRVPEKLKSSASQEEIYKIFESQIKDRTLEVSRELRALLYEADLLWGTETSQAFNAITKKVRELFIAKEYHKALLESPVRDPAELGKAGKIIIQSDDDPFRNDFEGRVKDIQAVLIPRLGLRP